MITKLLIHDEHSRRHKSLGADSSAAIITEGNDWGNDQLGAILTALYEFAVVPGNHVASYELDAGLGEENLERQVRRVHLDGQIPGVNDNGSQSLASLCTSGILV